MYIGLVHLHSALRWLLLVLLLITVVRTLVAWQKNQPFTAGTRKLTLFTFISLHSQLLIGLVLYFMSPTVAIALSDMASTMKTPVLRFYAVEHFVGMLVAIGIATVGYGKAKRAPDDKKNRIIAIYYGIALVLILALIPWPFREAGAGRGWF